jgi:type VI secretion system protein ImpH
MAPLSELLVNQGHRFSFFQALSLLEEFCASQGLAADPLSNGRVRLEADSSLAFPPSDIASIRDDDGVLRFFLSFMGLIGSSSPLPVYFAEYAETKPETAVPLRDFLAMFNHRLYVLFYRAWKKYRFLRSFSQSMDDPFTRRVASLAGIVCQGPLDAQRARLMAYAGLLAGRSRGSAGLCAMVSDWFGGIPVSLINWMPRWAPLRQIRMLGRDAVLGVNALAGTHMLDCAGKFRLVLGPLPRDTYKTFLPGSQNIRQLRELITAYIADPLEFDIEVQLQVTELVPVVLGADTAALGRTAALGVGREETEIQSVIIE